MKKAWTEAALLVALPLGAAWGFSHGYRLAALVLMATAFALIIGNYISAGHEIRRKHQKLQAAAMSDGRYLAENINHLGQLQAGPRGELPAEFLPQLEAVLREACEQNRSKSRSAAPSLSLSPWPSSQTHNHSSTAEQERELAPISTDSRYNLEGLRLCSSTGLGKDTAYNGGDPCRHFKATDVASVSRVIHTDNQLHAGQFGKAAYTGWIQTNESSATLSGPRAQAPLLRKFDRLHWLS